MNEHSKQVGKQKRGLEETVKIREGWRHAVMREENKEGEEAGTFGLRLHSGFFLCVCFFKSIKGRAVVFQESLSPKNKTK